MRPLLAHLLRLACIALAAVFAVPVLAEYPDRPIRLVVMYPAGGTGDIVARAVAAPMAKRLGQPVVVENRAGADGAIAAAAVAAAAPDGYTLLFATAANFSFAPAVHKSLAYDPVADFTPIGAVGDFGYFLVVHPSLPVRNLQEFIAYVKAHPGKLSHGAPAATSQVLSSAFANSQGLQFLQVPYKGEPLLAADLLTGRVDFSVVSGGQFLAPIREGKLRALATFLPARSPLLPDVPTFAEAGLPSPGMAIWTGLAGPAKLPQAIVDRVSAALQAALEEPGVRERFASLAGQVRAMPPREFGSFVQQQLLTWRKETTAAGLQAE